MDKKIILLYLIFTLFFFLLYPIYTGRSLITPVAEVLGKSCAKPQEESAKGFDEKKASILFVMDDGWKSQYTVGYEILEKYGFKGNIAVFPAMLDKENYMSLKQMEELYDDGWDMLNHTYNHVNLSNLTKSEQEKEILSSQKWLEKNCFSRGSKIMVYPYGGYNSQTISILKENNYLSGRTLEENNLNNANDIYEISVRNLTTDLDSYYAKKWIDEAIEKNQTVIFVNHKFKKINKDPAKMYYDPDDFEEVVKYAYQNSEDIEVLTYSQWLKKMSSLKNNNPYEGEEKK